MHADILTDRLHHQATKVETVGLYAVYSRLLSKAEIVCDSLNRSETRQRATRF
jgi:hypothetical protein